MGKKRPGERKVRTEKRRRRRRRGDWSFVGFQWRLIRKHSIMATSQQVLTLSCQEQTNEYLTTHHLRFTSLPPCFHSSHPPSLLPSAHMQCLQSATSCKCLRASIHPLSRSQVVPVKEIKRLPRPHVYAMLKERDLSVPRQVRTTSKPCTVCSMQTPQTWHFWSIVLPAPVSFILSPFDLCVRSLILRLQTPSTRAHFPLSFPLLLLSPAFYFSQDLAV